MRPQFYTYRRLLANTHECRPGRQFVDNIKPTRHNLLMLPGSLKRIQDFGKANSTIDFEHEPRSGVLRERSRRRGAIRFGKLGPVAECGSR